MIVQYRHGEPSESSSMLRRACHGVQACRLCVGGPPFCRLRSSFLGILGADRYMKCTQKVTRKVGNHEATGPLWRGGGGMIGHCWPSTVLLYGTPPTTVQMQSMYSGVVFPIIHVSLPPKNRVTPRFLDELMVETPRNSLHPTSNDTCEH